MDGKKICTLEGLQKKLRRFQQKALRVSGETLKASKWGVLKPESVISV